MWLADNCSNMEIQACRKVSHIKGGWVACQLLIWFWVSDFLGLRHLVYTLTPQYKNMVDFLTHYYVRDTGPFQSLSALPAVEAMKIMEGLCDDTHFGARFKDPAKYMRDRREMNAGSGKGSSLKVGNHKSHTQYQWCLGRQNGWWKMDQTWQAEKKSGYPSQYFQNTMYVLLTRIAWSRFGWVETNQLKFICLVFMERYSRFQKY